MVGVVLNPTWMHTAEYLNDGLKFGLVSVGLVWLGVMFAFVYWISTVENYRYRVVLNCVLFVVSLVFWLMVALTTAQMWRS